MSTAQTLRIALVWLPLAGIGVATVWAASLLTTTLNGLTLVGLITATSAATGLLLDTKEHTQ